MQDRQCTYNVTLTPFRLANHCYRGKVLSIAYSDSVFVDLVPA
jgi:hypothetical protein